MGGTQVKGAGPFPRWDTVLDLRSDRRRNPVAKAFVGSNPTPRTIGTTPVASEVVTNHAWNLKKEGYRESTIRSLTNLQCSASNTDAGNATM